MALGPPPALAGSLEGRAYEQVSPAHKPAGVGITEEIPVPQATADGLSVLALSLMPLPGSADGMGNEDNRFFRTDSGWATQPLFPAPLSQTPTVTTDQLKFRQGMSDDGRTTLYLTPRALDPADADGGAEDLYLRRPDGSWDWVSKGPINANDPSNGILWGVLSGDGRHVVFQSAAPLLPEDTARSGGLGLYDWHNGVLKLVGVDDAGGLLSTGSVDLGCPIFAVYQPEGSGTNVVSRDGSRIFFTIGGANGQSYVRMDGSTTRALGPGAAPGAATTFMGATPDGETAFVATDQALTNDDTDTSEDLYAFDVGSGSLDRLSGGIDGSVHDAQVRFPVGVRASNDGSTVYFEAIGSLTPDEPAHTAPFNVYVSEHGALRYLASVSGLSDTEMRRPPNCHTDDTDSNWRVTPDGGYLVFKSAEQLTPDDTDTSADIFEYELSSGELRRVSGQGAEGNANVAAELGAIMPTCGWSSYREPRVVSDDGRFVFFSTVEALAPTDTNGQRDVYEYDWSSGKTSLISAGNGPEGSLYLDNGASGQDVFFGTFDSLVPGDDDTRLDVYDARVGGGFPAPDAAPGCVESDCQGAPLGGFAGPVALGSEKVTSAVTPSRVVRKPTLTLQAVSRAERRRAARTGRLKVHVRASVAGTVFLHLQSRSKGRVVNVGTSAVRVTPRKATVAEVALSSGARRELRRRGHLSLTVRAALVSGHVVQRTHVRLSTPRAHRARAAARLQVPSADNR